MRITKKTPITNKAQLTQAILDSFNKPPTTEVSEAKELARQASEEMASAIDEYVQYQIGERLALILTALSAEISASRLPVALLEGPDFSKLTRKTST